MKNPKRATPFALLLVLFAVPAVAETPTDELLRTLIREVHELRVALEKTTILGYRGQLLIEQLRAQNSRIASLRSDLDDVHNQIENADREKAQLDMVTSNVDEEMKKHFDAESREPLERRMKMIQSSVDANERRKAALLQRQSEIEGRIDETEGRIDEIQRKIDLLDRSLETGSANGDQNQR